jgi:type VI secretion system protein ImpK
MSARRIESMKNQETKETVVTRKERRDLPEIASACFALILQLRRLSDFGDRDMLRQRVRELLRQVERDARDAGYAEEDIRLSVYALTAFLDETIIASEWSHKEDWLANPLQLESYARFDAGEEFFVRLEKLRQRPYAQAGVLKIYYLCMALGFKGKYQFQEKEKLRQMIEDTYADLTSVKGKPAEILSLHGSRKDEIVSVVARDVPLWVIAVFALALGFGFYLVMTLLVSQAANGVVQVMDSIL